MTALQVTDSFYDILFNRKSEGLDTIINDDVTFNGPFFKANGSKEFVEGMQRWGMVKKTFKILKQFIDGNDVCTIYTLTATSPTGSSVTWEETDWIKIKEGRLSSVNVYFDPREWAKAIGK